MKGVSEIIKYEAKKTKRTISRNIMGTLGATLPGNLLTGKGTIRAGEGAISPGETF